MTPTTYLDRLKLTPAEQKKLTAARAMADAVRGIARRFWPQSKELRYNVWVPLKKDADDARAAFVKNPTEETAAAILTAHAKLHAAELAVQDMDGACNEALAAISGSLSELAIELTRRAKAEAEADIKSHRERLSGPGLAAELAAFNARAEKCLEDFGGVFEAMRTSPLDHLDHHGVGID